MQQGDTVRKEVARAGMARGADARARHTTPVWANKKHPLRLIPHVTVVLCGVRCNAILYVLLMLVFVKSSFYAVISFFLFVRRFFWGSSRPIRL